MSTRIEADGEYSAIDVTATRPGSWEHRAPVVYVGVSMPTVDVTIGMTLAQARDLAAALVASVDATEAWVREKNAAEAARQAERDAAGLAEIERGRT